MRVVRNAVVLVAVAVIALSAFAYLQTTRKQNSFSFLTTKATTAQAHFQTDLALRRFAVISFTTVAVAAGLMYVFRDKS